MPTELQKKTILELLDGASPAGKKLNDRLALVLKIVGVLGIAFTIIGVTASFLLQLDGYHWILTCVFAATVAQVFLNFCAIKLRNKVFEYCGDKRNEEVPKRVRSYIANLSWLVAVCVSVVVVVCVVAILYLAQHLTDRPTLATVTTTLESQRYFESLIEHVWTSDRLWTTLLFALPMPCACILLSAWEVLLLLRSMLTCVGYAENVRVEFDELSNTDFVAIYEKAIE